MINELDVVMLAIDLPESGFKAGDQCVVVDISPNGGQVIVEFFDTDGETLAVVPLRPEHISPIKPNTVRVPRVAEIPGN